MPDACKSGNGSLGSLAAEGRAANLAMARGTLAQRCSEQAAAGQTARLRAARTPRAVAHASSSAKHRAWLQRMSGKESGAGVRGCSRVRVAMANEKRDDIKEGNIGLIGRSRKFCLARREGRDAFKERSRA